VTHIPPNSPPIGFLVWCPERGLPTYKHPTFLGAVDEAARLKRAAPKHRFVVMAPIEDQSGVGYALGFCRGRQEAAAQARQDVIDADARTDVLRDQLFDLQTEMGLLKVIRDNIDEFQAIVADCQIWFDGFAAAQSGAEPWVRSNLPSRDKLTALNAALQAVMRSRSADQTLDDEIPF
jgi:hypothetical protein